MEQRRWPDTEDQTFHYPLLRTVYPPPDVASHSIPPYGNVNASSGFRTQPTASAPTAVQENNGETSKGGDKWSGNEEKNWAGKQGMGVQSYLGEDMAGETTGRDKIKAPTHVPEPGALTSPAVVNFSATELAALEPLQPPRGHLKPPVLPRDENGVPMRADWARNGRVSSDRTKVKEKHITTKPEFFYSSLAAPPPEWGPTTADERHLFSYGDGVQLAPGRVYNREELALFLRGRPEGAPCTIRVGATPSQIANRLASEDTQCRWDGCPSRSRAIVPGWFRVGLDEFPRWTSDGMLDPYKMAGVMHLWCFEQCFDMVEYITKGRVEAENRIYPREERNSTALTRDTDRDIKDGFDVWYRDRKREEKGRKGDNSGWQPREHTKSFSYLLTHYHLTHQTTARHSSRLRRSAGKKSV